jgi:hypothetical protein
MVENRTDLLALPPWQHLGKERHTRLVSLMRPPEHQHREAG